MNDNSQPQQRMHICYVFIYLNNFTHMCPKSKNFPPPLFQNSGLDCVDHDKLWKALREVGIADHLTCLLRNLYVGQEATVRTLYGTTDWFKIEKGA